MALKLEAHELAGLLPKMNPAELRSLIADIDANGQREKIDLFEGKILDGRNRYDACLHLKIKPKTKVFRGSREDAVSLIYSRANHRNMNEGQRAIAAAKFEPHFSKLAAARKLAALNKGSRPGTATGTGATARDQAGALFGVSGRYVSDAKWLMEHASDLAEQVFKGELPLTRAKRAAQREHKSNELRAAIKTAPKDLTDCELIHGDVIDRLEKFKAKSVRVVFADPPYNIGKNYHGDATRDARSDPAFLDWCKRWLSECGRTLTADGSLFVMMNAHYAARLEIILRELGLHRRNTIYWWENNPEHQSGNFSDAVRLIHYFTRTRNDFVWNDHARVDSRRKLIGDKRAIDAGKVPDNVWIDCRIPGNARDRVPFADAPPQLPIAIPERCILYASESGDTVLDPFNGNGTTAIAALLNARKFIGIDQSKKYLEQSRKWIAAQLAARRAA